MERDFMGLNSKDSSVVVVKREAVEGCKDSAFLKGQQVQWSFPNAFDPSNKRQLGESQNLHSVHLDVKLLPGNPFLKTQFAAAPKKSHFLGGIRIGPPDHKVLPSTGSMGGSMEPWLNVKMSQAPAQLTIFYGGTVSVFDDISPEKAQAIMFLAGNSPTFNTGQPKQQVQAPISKPVAEDVFFVNQPLNTPPCSGLSSPMSVSSHPVRPSGGGLTNTDGPAKASYGVTTSINKVEAPKMVNGHVSVTSMIQSAVPQARKASLARFLEKRKERAMSLAPYNNLAKKPEDCSVPGSNGASLSGYAGLASVSISTSKESSL